MAETPKDVQVLDQTQLAVYEAVATLRRPAQAPELVTMTGLDEQTVHAAVVRLIELEMIVDEQGLIELGAHDWEVRGVE
jgi:hypothetical protein